MVVVEVVVVVVVVKVTKIRVMVMLMMMMTGHRRLDRDQSGQQEDGHRCHRERR